MDQLKVLQQENDRLREELEKSQSLVKDISAPIIPSILPETILVPIVGNLFPERFDVINAKVLKAANAENVTTVVMDFTAITEKELEGLESFAHHANDLKEALHLMGVKLVFVGFGPKLTLTLLQSDLANDKNLETYLTFKQALETLAAKRGYGFVKLNEQNSTTW
ncbi:STAS domain-containing protein [Bacillus testis]|uniref:STAS domain-containing protein n=1 Tax=Bacillus testis TaxID=1622072 RepID=UPI00067ECF5C|nr:STAS domain-containing protein [Bacillus testis]